jgi:hypothetical protein
MTATSVWGMSFTGCHPVTGAVREARTTAVFRFTPIANSTPLPMQITSGSRTTRHASTVAKYAQRVPRPDVGDVAAPPGVRRVGGEDLADQVRRRSWILTGHGVHHPCAAQPP